MRVFGAELTIVPSENGQITPDLVPRMMAKAGELAAEPDTYWTDQMNNADSLLGYRGVGDELLQQLPGRMDVFCAAVGTAGLAMGVAIALREAGAATRVVIFEPASTPVITGGKSGIHHVEGIGIGFVPPLLDDALYDEARGIEEEDGRTMARRLASEEGLLAGTSTGLNVAGAVAIARELGPGRSVATVAVDTGLKYLTGDLFDV